MVKRRIFPFPVFLSVLVGLAACTSPSSQGEAAKEDAHLHVAVYDGHGGAQTCVWEAYEALLLDPGIVAHYVRPSDIAGGILDRMDVVLVPGGGGSRQYQSLGNANRERLTEFIHHGGGYVGICAGAYLASSTPAYACLGILQAEAIDIAHDNRGHGVAAFHVTGAGRELFPELSDLDTAYISYYEGPVFDTTPPLRYEWLATMLSDVHVEGNAPANMTNGRPLVAAGDYGRGRVIACIAHPEGTPGMRWMVPRMARWAARAELIPYPETVVRPGLLDRELLFTPERLYHEDSLYRVLLHGEAEAQLEAIDWLERHASWSAKRWVQGMLYAPWPAVRLRAARFIEHYGFTQYLDDLESALHNEQDSVAREGIAGVVERLRAQRQGMDGAMLQ